MKEKIILVGGGGHCKSAIEVIESNAQFEILGILDVEEKVGQKILGYPIIGTSEQASHFISQTKNFHITIGQIKSAKKRIDNVKIFKSVGGVFPVIKAKTALISKHAHIEEGTILMHNTVVNSGAQVGAHCIVNTGSLIEHDSVIEDFCHISTRAVVNGDCKVGEECFLGSGAVMAHGVSLHEKSIIAAGATVYRSTKKQGIYMGFPLKQLK